MASSASENRDTSQVRTYVRTESIVFLKTKEAFGGLSNMAGGFPLRVNGIRIFSAEGLYQACRFPHMPEVQRIVLAEPSPMTAKMKVRPYRSSSRSDWDQVRVRIMRWCLRVKLAQHWKTFGDLLLATGDKPIVEESYKDDFWGAKPIDSQTLIGMNVLGRLLMELREEFKSERREALFKVDPLLISDFLLIEQPIPVIEALAQDSKRLAPGVGVSAAGAEQTSLFDQHALFDAEVSDAPMCKVNELMPQTYSNSNSAIADLKPYTEYKDSGLPWLGKIPAHWGLAPNRALMHRRKVLVGERHANYKLLSLTKVGVIIRDVASGKGKFSSDMGTSQEVRKGDLVFCLFDVPETPRTVGLSSYDGMITGAYTVFECSGSLLARYLDCYYRAMDDRKLLSPLYSGLRNTIPPTRFLGTKTAIPPVEEQAAIVRFLNHATRRLDKAIRDKRKIIALLNEQKQAIIHRAVTRGLDPDVPLKDSGIPWLGQIPAHWDTPLNQRIFKEDIRSHNGIPETQLSLSQRDGLIATDDMQERSLQTASYDNWKVTVPGDLVLNRFKAHLGVFFASTLRGIVSFHYGVFAPRRVLHTKYFELLFHTYPYRAIYAGRSNGMTVGLQNLSNQSFYNVRCVVPPTNEQAEIITFVEQETKALNTAISCIEKEIELLREYRTRLIADVVTGKLDVREAAARLPEEAETSAEPADMVPEDMGSAESAEELMEEDA